MVLPYCHLHIPYAKMAQFQPKFPTNAHASLDILDLNANINVLRASTEYVISMDLRQCVDALLDTLDNCAKIRALGYAMAMESVHH